MRNKEEASPVSDLSNWVPLTEIVQIEDIVDREAEDELNISHIEFEVFSRYYEVRHGCVGHNYKDNY